MEQTEDQYLVFNAFESLELITRQFYDVVTGTWYLETVSQVLPVCRLMPDGEILPLEVDYE
jgi:hypothetical protein